MGSHSEPQHSIPCARALVRQRLAAIYHVERATSRMPHNRVFPATATGVQPLPTLGQHSCHRYFDQADHTLPRNDDRIAVTMAVWHMLDVNDIRIRPRYIRSAANVWADSFSRELDRDDKSPQLNPRIEAHSIHRFASIENTHLPRYNAKWRDPIREDIDCLHLPNATCQRDAN
jgi:hypothetical protein